MLDEKIERWLERMQANPSSYHAPEHENRVELAANLLRALLEERELLLQYFCEWQDELAETERVNTLLAEIPDA